MDDLPLPELDTNRKGLLESFLQIIDSPIAGVGAGVIIGAIAVVTSFKKTLLIGYVVMVFQVLRRQSFGSFSVGRRSIARIALLSCVAAVLFGVYKLVPPVEPPLTKADIQEAVKKGIPTSTPQPAPIQPQPQTKQSLTKEQITDAVKTLLKTNGPAGRQLSPSDVAILKTKLTELMSDFGTRTATGVDISALEGDEEAFRYAQQIQEVFRESGWPIIGRKVSRFSKPAGVDPVPTGLMVMALGGGMSDAEAGKIRETFGLSYSQSDEKFADRLNVPMYAVQVKVWSQH